MMKNHYRFFHAKSYIYNLALGLALRWHLDVPQGVPQGCPSNVLQDVPQGLPGYGYDK